MSLRWDWLQAIAASDLPSTTRLVLHTLALHMDRLGSDCFPGLTTIARESGVDRRTVRRHLASADSLGWVERERERRSNGSWGRTTYVPTIPSEDVGAHDPHVSEDVGAQDPQVGAQDPQVGAQDPQGRGSVPTPRRGSVPPKTVETDKETDRETLSEGTDPGPTEDDRVSAKDVIALWISHRGSRPLDAVLNKQAPAAQRLAERFGRSDIERAMDGIGRLYPHDDGEPWDLFDLERKMGKALDAAEAGQLGRSGFNSWLYSDAGHERESYVGDLLTAEERAKAEAIEGRRRRPKLPDPEVSEMT